ncbi:hypothetical protein SADUNF_Sadunf06G0010100 [Salix dunnii]|uniref:AAA+ ATPase domain-containing protein n=1 Tax=Salix dunnii TaxID=1413687 RepID=A0A835K0B3_9ROSI|nr:hypothetical protein SADUNF_Sadunf06G0010100 [Salix dunnii]
MAVVDAMLQVLTQQVFTILKEQASFPLDFKDQFELMKTKLDLTKALLADTENLNEKKKVVTANLIQLRDLIYEADNIMTDCLVRDEYEKEGSCTSLTFKKPLFWYQTGKKLKDVNSKLDAMERSLGIHLKYQEQSDHGGKTTQVTKYTVQDYVPSEVIGLEEDLEKLKGWISDTKDKLLRVGIFGMGGLGKTTIAQKLFNDQHVAARYDKMIWVSVSQVSSDRRIMRSMLEQLESHCSVSDEAQMLHKLNELLKGKTCLIVMDDVWKINRGWWNQFFSGLDGAVGKGSCIIITTRKEDVLTSMGVGRSQFHTPKVLTNNDSWLLFSKSAFSSCPDAQFEKVGKEILEKCGGLPLAIKAIASLLASKSYSIVHWNEINKNFHESTADANFTPVMMSLKLSYDELPIHLKQCLLCFSAYPEDSEIQAEQLIHWWVGEGLVQGKGSKTAKELGYCYLSELVTRCLVEAVHRREYDGRVYCCKVHDLVRELIIRIAEEESFGKFDEHGRQEMTGDSRWLGFTSEMNPEIFRKSSKLRALLITSADDHVVFDRHIGSLGSLRVLDFSLTKLAKISTEKLMEWISSLKRLAYLNLSGVVGLKELPKSFRKLRNLQFLVFAGCNELVKIDHITSLRKLVVLDLGSCLLYLPSGIEKLSHLQELSGFNVASNSRSPTGFKFCDLEKLVHLRVLRMSIGKDSEITEKEREVLLKLKKLKVLSIDAQDCEDNNISTMLNIVLPPPSLRELYLRRYHRDTLPKWINPEKLSNLQYICIENADIIDFQTSPKSVDGSVFRWNIEGLRFKVLRNLKLDWKNLEKDMPLLRYADVSDCLNLQNFPRPINNLAIWRRRVD